MLARVSELVPALIHKGFHSGWGQVFFANCDDYRHEYTPDPENGPDKDTIATLPEFPRLGLGAITLVANDAQAQAAAAALLQAPLWGFDTESKPTFHVGQVSDGPHVLQLSTTDHAWVFQLIEPECVAVAAQLLCAPGIVKAGFGLGDDHKRIVRKLGVVPVGVLDLNTVFRAQGYRRTWG